MDYDSSGYSYYEGDWLDNKKYGMGIRHYQTGNLKIIQFLCSYKFSNFLFLGNVFEGMWINNVRHGFGTMKWNDKNQIYIGYWENGVQVTHISLV